MHGTKIWLLQQRCGVRLIIDNIYAYYLKWANKMCCIAVGVRFLCHDMLVTTSVDQRLAVWKIVRDSTGFSVRMASCFTHSVADVSSLGLYHTRYIHTVASYVQCQVHTHYS